MHLQHQLWVGTHLRFPRFLLRRSEQRVLRKYLVPGRQHLHQRSLHSHGLRRRWATLLQWLVQRRSNRVRQQYLRRVRWFRTTLLRWQCVRFGQYHLQRRHLFAVWGVESKLLRRKHLQHGFVRRWSLSKRRASSSGRALHRR
jgi:hypothetical protein